MAATSPITPPEKPKVFSYYFQIPQNAEVKRVPISILSSSVRQRISRLGVCSDFTNTPYVIVVSPVTKQKLPNSHIARSTANEVADEHFQVVFSDTGQSPDQRSSMGKADKQRRKDHGTYLVPMKCCKDTALTILQLSQTSNEEKSTPGRELPNVYDSLILNLQVIKMKATAMCMYKNIMYLLPESKMRNRRSDGREKAGEARTTELQPEADMSSDSDCSEDGLGTVTMRHSIPLQQQHHRLENSASGTSATVVKLWNEDKWDLPAQKKSTYAHPSSIPSTENTLQISFLEHSRRQIKRKLSYFSNGETFIKKINLSGCDLQQDSPAAKNAFSHSSLPPHLPSLGSPSSLGLLESPHSHSPSVKSAILEGPTPFSILCNVFPPMASASLTPEPSCRENPPRPNAKSGQSLSGVSTGSEYGHESAESNPCLVSSPSSSGLSRNSKDSHEADESQPCLKPLSSPSRSGFNTNSKDNHEADESQPCLKPMPSPYFPTLSTSSEASNESDDSHSCLKPISRPSSSGVGKSSEASHAGDNSQPCLKPLSSSSRSGFNTNSKDNHEADESQPCLKPMPSPYFPTLSTSSEASNESDESHSCLKPMSRPSSSGVGIGSEASHAGDNSQPCLEPMSSPSLSDVSTVSEDNHESDESHPYLNTMSSPSLSGVSIGSEDRHEAEESHLCLEPISRPSSSGVGIGSEASHAGDNSQPCREPMSSPSLSDVSTVSEDNYESDESHPYLNTMSSPSLSGVSIGSEDSHEGDESHPSLEPSSDLGSSQSVHASFPIIDDITRDEAIQRLLDRVKECKKRVEDIRQNEKIE
ncbi:uncharacterized protein [Dendropsophus ebraccatus]|uniref:uncharacterized protein n=1 Tax=Dendropsophus ebraccatus TaxID=150705 RepID=UPI0038311BA0